MDNLQYMRLPILICDINWKASAPGPINVQRLLTIPDLILVVHTTTGEPARSEVKIHKSGKTWFVLGSSNINV